MKSYIVSPAYGRKFNSISAVKEYFAADKDWQIEGPINEAGRYGNRSNFQAAGASYVEIRYGNRLEKALVINL